MFVHKVKHDKVKVLCAKGTTYDIVAEVALAAAVLHAAMKKESPERAAAFIKMVQAAVADESPIWELTGHRGLLKTVRRKTEDA